MENEKEKVQAFSEKIGVPIVGEVPRSNEIIHWEEQGKTVIEGDPASEISRCFFDLATLLWKEEEKRMRQEAYFCTVKELDELGKNNIPRQLISHTHLIYSSPATLAFNSPGAEGFGVKRAGLAVPGLLC